MRKLLIAVLLLLPGCVHTNALQGQIAERGAQVNDEALQSAMFVVCRGVSIGAWRRAFGNDPQKADAWRTLCAESISQTPEVR
jgi:hypothetical protein